MSNTLWRARRRRERPVIYGRKKECARLRDLLDDAIAGHGSLVLISGEAGIGKTTLIEDLVERAGEYEVLVLAGGCYDLTTTPPYGPWIEILRDYPGDRDLPPVPDPLREGTGLEGIHSQAALFDLAGRFFHQVAEVRPLVLVLEDLHWADHGSLEILRFLGRSLASHRILILATYRNDEITRRDPLFQLIPTLVRETSAARVDVQQWKQADIRSFVVSQYALQDEDKERLAPYLLDRASGNPLFVVELVRTLESESVLSSDVDGWRVGDLSGVPVPMFVVQLIEGRLRALDADIYSLLEIAAVIGQDVSVDLWKRVSGASDEQLSAALERGIEIAILEEAPGELRVRFHHALIREALYGKIRLLRRRDLHRATADALLEMPQPDPDEVITHLSPASDPRLVDWLIRSGDRAMSRFAWDTAVERYARASSLLEVQETIDPARVCEVLLRLGEAQNSAGSGRGQASGGAGDVPDAQATFRRVAVIARESGLPEPLGEAALGIAGLNFATDGGPDGFRLMGEALAALPDDDSALRARLLARLATGALLLSAAGIVTDIATVEQVDEWSAEAVARARRIGDARTLGYALHARNDVIWGLYDFEESQANYEEWLALATQMRDLPLVAWALSGQVGDLSMVGNLQAANETFARFVSVVEQLHMPVLDWYVAVHRSGEHLSAGRYDETRRGIEQINAAWPGSASAMAQAVVLYRELGDPQAMGEASRQTFYPALSLPVRLQCLLEEGEVETARDQFQSFVDSGYFARGLPKRWAGWLKLAAVIAETCAALGDARRAALIYDKLSRFDGLNIFAGYALYSMGAVAHYLGILATTMSDWDTAERHFSRALEQNDRWGFRPAAAYTRYEWATMLTRRDRPGDRERARTLLSQALATANELGMVRLKRFATALARDLGISEKSHPSGLSSREVEVLELVARGMTNVEIGEALFISPRTVAQHLRSVYNKLGVNSRAAAVSRWAEIGRS